MRFQADANTMQGIRLFVVDNTSSPAEDADERSQLRVLSARRRESRTGAGPRSQRPAHRGRSRARKPKRTATPSPSRCVREKRSFSWSSRCPTRARSNRSQAALSRRALGRRGSQVHAVQAANPPQLSSPCRIPTRATPVVKWRSRRSPASRWLHPQGHRNHHRVSRRDRLGRSPAAGQQQARKPRPRQSPRRRTRRAHRRSRRSAAISLAHPRRIRRAASHRRMGGHQAADHGRIRRRPPAQHCQHSHPSSSAPRPTRRASADSALRPQNRRCCWRR